MSMIRAEEATSRIWRSRRTNKEYRLCWHGHINIWANGKKPIGLPVAIVLLVGVEKKANGKKLDI